MRRICKTGVMVSAIAVLAACQTTPANHNLHAEARPLIKSVDSVLISKQTEVGADIKTMQISKYLQGHIIPVLLDVGVNVVRSKNAKKNAAPIRETLSDYDYAADIKEEFNLALAKSGIEGVNNLHIVRQEPQGFRVGLIQHSKADAVMFVDVKYAFTPSFDNLNLTSAVLIYPINPELSPYKEKPDTDRVIEYSDNIYRNQFMASVPVGPVEPADGVEVKSSDNAAKWAELSEEQLTGKLQKAARKLAEAIAADMKADEVTVESEDWDADSPDLTTEPIIIDTNMTD